MIFRYFIIFLLVSLLSSCVTDQAAKKEHSENVLYEIVPLQPGAVAWSPDSLSLGVISDDKLIIRNTLTGNSRQISGISPVYLDWAPGKELLAVSKTDGNNELVRINAANGKIHAVSLEDSPIAARWFHPPDSILTLSTSSRILSIGRFVTYRLTISGQTGSNLFLIKDSYFPTRRPDTDVAVGWGQLAVRPFHDTVLTPEFHDPPRVEPYIYFKTIDPVNLSQADILKQYTYRFNIPASWSSDGARLAITNDKGLLVIADMSNPGNAKPVNHKIRGRFPSWHPEKSLIYFGGWLMQSDGTESRQILPGASGSIGTWSPDGKRLAVISGESLYLFEVF